MKRIISFVLCMSMLLSMVPVSVFASETEETAAAETFPVVETTEATEIQLPTEETAEFREAAAAETAAAQAETSVPETVPETTAAAEVPETTEATVPQETEAEEEILWEYTYIPGDDFPDSDELFAGYAEQQFYGTEMATFGIAAGARLPENQKFVYDLIVDSIRDIAAGERSSAHIAVGYELGNITYSDNFVAPHFPDEEKDVSDFSLSTDEELDIFLSALLADLPYELYWFDKVAGIRMHGATRVFLICYLDTSIIVQ